MAEYNNNSNFSDGDYNDYYNSSLENASMLLTVPLIKQPLHMITIYSIAYGLVFIFAVIGNILVIALIYKDPSMRNVTNYFILNMAVADLLVAFFCLPITMLANIFSGWRFGAFLCKSTPYIQSVVQCASVNTLAAIAFDRYLAICYSRHSKISACASRTTIINIWVFASTVMIPLAVYYELYMHPHYKDVPMCHQLWPTYQLQRGYFLLALFILCYLLPLLMILVCYLLIAMKIWKRNAPGIANGRLIIYKSKVKVLKMLAVIVLLFAFSWLPLYAVFMYFYYGEASDQRSKIIYDVILPISQWLGSSNCGVNPIIYCFFSKKYRRGFRNILYCRFADFAFRRNSRTTQSLSTRYINVDNSSAHCHDHQHETQHHNRLPNNKYMVVAFCNGRMTVSFRKDNGEKDDSSF